MDGLSRPRYSHQAFPPYRFIPGRHPHPTAHPDGHSFHAPGEAPHTVVLPAPNDWASSEVYLYAADLYNHGYWWEAHEAWEALWQLTDKSKVQGRFLQALIQSSACHLKWYMGHLPGVQRLLESSLGYWRFVCAQVTSEAYMGLRHHRFVDDLHRYYQTRTEAMPHGGVHCIQTYPYVVLS